MLLVIVQFCAAWMRSAQQPPTALPTSMSFPSIATCVDRTDKSEESVTAGKPTLPPVLEFSAKPLSVIQLAEPILIVTAFAAALNNRAFRTLRLKRRHPRLSAIDRERLSTVTAALDKNQVRRSLPPRDRPD